MSTGKKIEKKNHINYKPYEKANGTGNSVLHEPVPEYQKIPGETILRASDFKGGVDNNTMIIMGRSRKPFRKNREGKKLAFDEDKLNVSETGFASHMGAGMMDLVVGRGAPYPVKDPFNPTGEPISVAPPRYLPPLYISEVDANIRKNVTLSDESKHSGLLMDAARVYISQMCDVDSLFEIHKTKKDSPVQLGASSTVVVKADKLRFHARRDIKIVAGGDSIRGATLNPINPDGTDSNGHRIDVRGSIHLIAGNGKYRSKKNKLEEQQPIPKGDNLVLCLKALMAEVRALGVIMGNVVKNQKQLNKVMAKSPQYTATGATLVSPFLGLQGMISCISEMKDMLQLYNQTTANSVSFEDKFLEKHGENYINSRYNTTN
tara:strand:+ start:8580 stop:9707 length:1128 start_codon:yes stop_codon:yes gene_type:complete